MRCRTRTAHSGGTRSSTEGPAAAGRVSAAHPLPGCPGKGRGTIPPPRPCLGYAANGSSPRGAFGRVSSGSAPVLSPQRRCYLQPWLRVPAGCLGTRQGFPEASSVRADIPHLPCLSVVTVSVLLAGGGQGQPCPGCVPAQPPLAGHL